MMSENAKVTSVPNKGEVRARPNVYTHGIYHKAWRNNGLPCLKQSHCVEDTKPGLEPQISLSAYMMGDLLLHWRLA